MKKVLIVEDESDVMKVLKFRVASLGCDIITAVNGKEALAVLKIHIPDLIISDVLMPEMDGFQLYKILKQDPLTAKIPVLILTARGKMEESFRIVGVDDFIAKPYEADDFIAKVNKLLNKSSAAAPVPAETSMPVSAGKRVLIVGSDQEVANKIVGQLTQHGCSAQSTQVSAEIMSQCATSQPQVLIIDILMPDMSASDLVQVVRKMPRMENVPVILYSFYKTEGLSGEEVQQNNLSIDAEKERISTEANVLYIGTYSQGTFLKLISKYI